MFEREKRIADLILAHFFNWISAEEKAELDAWLAESPLNKRFLEELHLKENLSAELASLDRKKKDDEHILEDIYRKIGVSGG